MLAFPTEEDLPELCSLLEANVEHLSRWMPWAVPGVADLEGQRERLRDLELQFEAGSDFSYLVKERESGAILGSLGAHARLGPAAIELGYWLGKEAEGRGFMSEAVAAMTRCLLGYEEIARVVIRADPENVRSWRVPQRVGYTREGVLRNVRFENGAWRDSESWSMVAGESPRESWRPTNRPPRRFSTERLELVKPELEDLLEYERLVDANIEHLAPWIPWASRYEPGRGMARQRIEAIDRYWLAGRDFHYVLRQRAEARLVGAISVHFREGPDAAELGYWLGVANQGHGYVTEAARALATWLLDELEVIRVVIQVDPKNEPSRAVPRRLGFALEGILRKNLFFRDKWHDSESWSMIQGERPSGA